MTLVQDVPITKQEDDKFGFNPLAKNIAQAIYDYKQPEGFVLGITGVWGSGKSSLINLVKINLKNIEKSKRGREKHEYFIMNFSPWNVTSSDALVKEFFYELHALLRSKHKLDKRTVSREKYKKLADSVEKYGKILTALDCVSVPGVSLKPFASIMTHAADLFKNSQNESINEQKEQIVYNLKELNQKIIICIDDIDRLACKQVKTVFRLINSIAGFPNIIYILAYDKQVITQILKTEQKKAGDNYLRKIVQSEYPVPELSLAQRKKFFESKFTFRDELPDYQKSKDENKYYDYVLTICILPYIQNARDVIIFYNAFILIYSAIGKNVNYTDLLAITAIRIFSIDLYCWIARHPEKLCSNYENNTIDTIKNISKKDNDKDIQDEIDSKIYGKEEYLIILGILFPKFAQEHKQISLSLVNSKSGRHISFGTFFNLYFSFNGDDSFISQDLVFNCINEYSPDNMLACLNKWKEQNKLSEFYDELASQFTSLKLERYIEVIKVLLIFNSEPFEPPYQLVEDNENDKLFSTAMFFIQVYSLKVGVDIDKLCSVYNTLLNDFTKNYLSIGYMLAKVIINSKDLNLFEEKNSCLNKTINKFYKLLISNCDKIDLLIDQRNFYTLDIWKTEDIDTFCNYFNKKFVKDISNIMYFILISKEYWKGKNWSEFMKEFSNKLEFGDSLDKTLILLRKTNSYKKLNSTQKEDISIFAKKYTNIN